MAGMLRQWWLQVLRALSGRLAQKLAQPPPISDDEIDQLGRDSWSLYGDISGQSLRPCAPVRVRGFWQRVDAKDGHVRGLVC